MRMNQFLSKAFRRKVMGQGGGTTLARKLGVFDITALGVGSTLGAGCVKPPSAAELLTTRASHQPPFERSIYVITGTVARNTVRVLCCAGCRVGWLGAKCTALGSAH